MPVLMSIPPSMLKDAFASAGYRVIAEDEYNWALALATRDEPFILPKKGRLVSMEIMQAAAHHGDGALSKAIMERVSAFVAPAPSAGE